MECAKEKGAEECCDQDPAEGVLEGWKQAYRRAYHEVQVEVLKERVRKTWGKQMESFAGDLMAWAEKEFSADLDAERTCEQRAAAHAELLKKLRAAFPS